jgi:hypothetical protein
LTGSQKNIFYQMASVDFSIKKGGQFDRLAINQMRFNSSGWWGGFT